MTERDGKTVILVVDDEPLVRNVVQMTLIRAGYDVFAASDGTEALHLSRAYTGAIHLLLSDVKIPNMIGTELATTIMKERPGIHVLLMTGKSLGRIPSQLRSRLLCKPFLPRQLLEHIHRVLGKPQQRL